jgi:hypothetical protein
MSGVQEILSKIAAMAFKEAIDWGCFGAPLYIQTL